MLDTSLLQQAPTPADALGIRSSTQRPPREAQLRIFMMDLLSIVPYYDAHLCEALQTQNVSVMLGAITYHLDRSCFRRHNISTRPGLLDIVGRFKLPKRVRRVLKLLETAINMTAIAARFLWCSPNVVHVQYLPMLQWGIPIDFWFLRYCRKLGSSLVCTVHDILPSDTGEKHAERFQRLYSMMDAIICHSDAVKQQLITRFAISPDRIRVIPHGPFFHDLPAASVSSSQGKLDGDKPEVIVLFQGLIRPYKGVDFLLDAWREVHQSGSRAKLVIAGNSDDVSLLNAIREQVHSLALENSVELRFKFLPLEEMIACYHAANIVVYPYKAVTTSGALMTGVAQGKAIIATSLSPFLEILEHEKNALLCSYGDSSQLAAALLRLINDSALRGRLGREASKLNLGRKAWQQIAGETYDCYLSVTRRPAISMLEDHSTV